jgi:signal transduction histidine kinase
LSEDNPPEDANRLAGIVKVRALSLQQLITDLFDLTKLDYGGIKAELTSYDAGQLMEELAGYYVSELGGEANPGISANIETHKHIMVDTGLMTRVFDNLVNNAIRYTGDGGRLVFGCREEGDKILLSLSDNGVGIATEIMPRIFDRHVKGHKGGSGLGLAIVKEIAGLHGGAVYAESEPGKGSTFTIALHSAEESRHKERG